MDDRELARLRALLDRIAGDEVDRAIGDALTRTRRRAEPLVRDILVEELSRSSAEAEGPEPEREPAPVTEALDTGPPTSAMAWYVYAVVEAADGDGPGDLPGVDPRHPVQLLPHDGMSLAASRVDPASMARSGSDVAFLTDLATRHDLVMWTLARWAATVPLHVGTVVATASDVHAIVEADRERFLAALDLVRGRDEYGVQVIAESVDREPKPPPTHDPDQGTRYLRTKSAHRLEERERAWEAEAAATNVHRVLSELSAAVRTVAPIGRGAAPDVVSNRSYLVDRAEADTFRATVERLNVERRAAGVRVRLTGPWPAYSFVTDPVRDEAGHG